ncbi:MAG: hypothetical protein RMA76_03975 [Deltaproteobacteria bacterium]|jgi:hypothetical protein
MKTISAAFVAACLFTGATADATTLRYTWKKGSKHRFAAKSKDTMNMSTMGMKIAQRTTTDSTFTLRIDRVRPDGTAEGTLYIESFTVRDESGRVLGTIEGLPPSSLKSLVTVDRRGRFTFQEHVYLIVQEGQNVVVTNQVGPNGAVGTVNDGEEEVTVWATIDPNTGRLSGGASVKKVAKQKKTRRVKIRQDTPRVDLVPRMFMELLRLPDGAVGDGAVQVAMNHPNLSNDTRVTAQILDPSPKKTRVKTTFETKAAMKAPVDAPEDDEDDDMAMGGGMPDLGGVPGMGGIDLSGMPGMGGGGAAPGATVDTKMRVDGWATIVMNRKAGTLQSLKGRITSKTSMGGMASVDTDSELELTRR